MRSLSRNGRAALVALLLVVLHLESVACKRKKRPRPPTVVQALKPSGLRISVSDEGLDLVIINANINKPLELKETGQVSKTVSQTKDGFWTFTEPNLTLKPEDGVFYSIYYSIGGEGTYFGGYQVIFDLVDPECGPSITTMNGRPACKGALIFEDNFDLLNLSVWSHDIQFSDPYNFHFNTYVANKENSFVKDGVLHLKPSVEHSVDELMKPLKLEGCTAPEGGESCERKPFAWDILPPTRSARIISKQGFSFKYGRVEVRAKTADGDWLRSRMWLAPLDNYYGPNLHAGRIKMMTVNGNRDLQPPEGWKDNGADSDHVQIQFAACNNNLFLVNSRSIPSLLSDGFHTYGVTWTSKGIRIDLDGAAVMDIHPPQPGGFLDYGNFDHCQSSSWERGTFMAPFDREFYFYISLSVGGHYVFSDNSKSGKHVKPYIDKSPKGPLDFWRARDDWLPTWNDDYKIDYVKVWAL